MSTEVFSKHISVSITEDMDQYLTELATRQGCSRAEIVRQAIKVYQSQKLIQSAKLAQSEYEKKEERKKFYSSIVSKLKEGRKQK